MAELTAQCVDQVLAACQAGAAEAAEAFGRALDGHFSLEVGQPGKLDLQNLPEALSGPGLAILLVSGGSGAVILLPESSQLLPPWCINPDPTGQSKLTTLAQELGMIVLPEELTPEDFKTAYVKNLAGALGRGGPSDDAATVPLELTADGKQAVAQFIWPIAKPASVFGAAAEKPSAEAAKPPEAKTKPPSKPATEDPTKPAAAKVTTAAKPAAAACKAPRELPGYTRSLLHIQVPVVVTLAEKRQPLRRIVELGPGAIIQFEKSCEEMLELEVGGRPIAVGEAVKVGDKFGLRISSMIMPEERFLPVTPGAP